MSPPKISKVTKAMEALVKYGLSAEEMLELSRSLWKYGRAVIQQEGYAKFRVGQTVRWKSRRGFPATGTVLKVNITACKVQASSESGGRIWNIDFSILEVIE
jgi:hypothetical protein